MPQIIKAASSADFLAMVPLLVGFEPRNSLVLVTFRGKRTCGALRIDIPDSTSATVLKRVATTVVGTLCRVHEVDAIVPVVFTDAEFGSATHPPQATFARILNRRIVQSGFELRDSFCLASDGWASYLDEEVPAGGHPINEVLRARAVLPSIEPIVHELPVAHADQLRLMSNGLDELRAARLEDDFEALAFLSELPVLVEQSLYWDDDQIDALGPRLVYALQAPPFRDHAMLQWASDGAVGWAIWEELFGDRPVDLLGGDLIMGVGPRPDPERIEGALALLRVLASRVTGDERRPLLCMLAWLNWAMGRGTIAGRYVDEARSIDPDYGMAELLDSVLVSGMLPEWAFDAGMLHARNDLD